MCVCVRGLVYVSLNGTVYGDYISSRPPPSWRQRQHRGQTTAAAEVTFGDDQIVDSTHAHSERGAPLPVSYAKVVVEGMREGPYLVADNTDRVVVCRAGALSKERGMRARVGSKGG